MPANTPTPLSAAVKAISAKTPIGSILRTAEWQGMPQALRNRGQFSAGVESIRLLQAIQNGLTNMIGNVRGADRADGSPGTFTSRTGLIADLREIALSEGLVPADDTLEGGLQDITSERRLKLIVDTQTEQAHEFAFWKRGQDPDVLDGWPAQELIRIRSSRVERDWHSRWMEAGGSFVEGRMVALKTDPIWTKLSVFGNPWPPFDFNSGMGVEEIDREEAERLGLIEPGQKLEPIVSDFNDNLQASVTGLDEGFKAALKTLFGDQIETKGDVVRWTGQTEAPNERFSTQSETRQDALGAFEGYVDPTQGIKIDFQRQSNGFPTTLGIGPTAETGSDRRQAA